MRDHDLGLIDYIGNWGIDNMCTLEIMEIEILKHLYERGILDINEGWEKQSKLDYVALDILYHFGLVEKSIFEGLVRLSERGVGAVLFGLQNAEKISEML
jgi:hypothetical protein